MVKKKCLFLFIIFVAIFFFCREIKVNAAAVVIEEIPVAEEISYGEPLFESTLIGGRANVEGTFSWKNGRVTFDVGEYNQVVVFTPTSSLHSSKEFLVKVKVNPRRAFLNFEEEIYKQYDGLASLSLPNYIVGGIIDKTVYVKGDLSGSLESVLVGTSKVILSGIELAGEKSEQYYLDLTGFQATVHPRIVAKFGPVKNRIDLVETIYVPIDSLMYTDDMNLEEISKEGYSITSAYDVYIKSGNSRVTVDTKVKVRLLMDERDFEYKRLKIYNYFNGVYEEVEYTYSEGYIEYSASALGILVFAQKELNFWWLYILIVSLVLTFDVILIVKKMQTREKVNKYKSLKRSRDEDGNY